ncbi:MAG: serine/threonine protein kinase [Bradymonadaceae bacterium]|nr:serine/threonine protein kinase [Lujinxingiaceae bacterium]
MTRMPEVGELVDDVFRIESKLDAGNFGAVYKVHDILEDRTIALKVLKPGPHDEAELRQRFEREARLVYSLQHPHVVEVYYYGETASGLPYMAMEYLNGTDLRSLIHHNGPLNPALIRRISLEVLSALETAHEIGIVHRDLKPANIYLVNDGGKGHVKVLDFGFAKALDGESQGEITNAGTLVGTPAYMSPELVHKKNVGPPADLYAMGLIMAEMIMGEKLIKIESVYETILFQASPKNIKMPAPVANSLFAQIINRSVAKDLAERYKSATEIIEDLKRLDIPGVGPLSNGAPSEYGNADMNARTRPRSTGMPSIEEVDRALGLDPEDPIGYPPIHDHDLPMQSRPMHSMAEDEPTFDRPPERLSSPSDSNARPEDSFIMGNLAIPASSAPASNSGMGEIFVGIIVGLAILSIILAFIMHLG